MDIWNVEKLSLFLVFILPGFISLVVYDYLIPSTKREFSKSIIEVVCFSTLNFIVLSFLIYLNLKYESYNNSLIVFYLSLLIVFIIMPALWPIIFVKFSNTKFFKTYFIHPIAKPWDYFFGKKEAAWVIIHLKNGKMIGGKYSTDSFASSYPDKEQIYLEEVWKLDENGVFISKIERTKGIIIIGDDISSIEFFI
ncbi:MAG: DUF6338 family protein [Stygiobacter sp.]